VSHDQGHADERLAALRRRIDALDAELVRLISERGEVAREIGALKAGSGAQVYAPDREKQVYARLSELNAGPFPDSVLQAVYRELMSGSLALERPQRIAYLGPRGSFSHLAALAKFGAAVEYEPVTDIGGAFSEVARRRVDFAVVPVENSTGGGVIDTLDAFLEHAVKVCAEVVLRIHHHVLSRVPLEEVARIYSKPEVFSQCRNWLLGTGLLSRTVPVASSSKAAELAAAEPNAAAIGSTLAAELYGLPILVSGIEDNPQNITRFFVLGQHPARPTGDDKTVAMFTAAHRAGALVDVLDVFRTHGVNLTMITSRPSRRQNWEYCFFLDAEGHAEDPALTSALAAAREHCLTLTVLGSYPRAVTLD
jgi:chorismate mutase/prephenate dehydratase